MSGYDDSGAGPSRTGGLVLELSANYQPPKKKKRVKHDTVYSQPLDTGIGKNANTQLFFVLGTLKKRNGPMSLRDLSIMTNNILETDPTLLERFEAHENVVKNPTNGLYTYRQEQQHESFASRDELLKEIKSHSRRGGGLSFNHLKTTWNGAPTVVEELENEGLILVTRSSKDGQPKMVFWNDIPPQEGGKQIESEFQQMWQSLKWPAEGDLERVLTSMNRTVAQTSGTAALASNKNSKSKKSKNTTRVRHVKIQNTHLANIDLTKDYTPPSTTGS
ncbi:uncharacterized protein EI90DRAFT_3056241 [Cantharellus anzutake]|uniref:uncharacterized protein n=1 Tax=Cantharellus anzutake TaxID=1750568 RepID=UPI001906C4A9|nr:uncharacterized protein EI90DRAFT_3056241 [Cantharellus anzutake]KAF8332008.1 hypothetical protein EI90DRAFT_3056241 [Cantharellus anzutake]